MFEDHLKDFIEFELKINLNDNKDEIKTIYFNDFEKLQLYHLNNNLELFLLLKDLKKYQSLVENFHDIIWDFFFKDCLNKKNFEIILIKEFVKNTNLLYYNNGENQTRCLGILAIHTSLSVALAFCQSINQTSDFYFSETIVWRNRRQIINFLAARLKALYIWCVGKQHNNQEFLWKDLFFYASIIAWANLSILVNSNLILQKIVTTKNNKNPSICVEKDDASEELNFSEDFITIPKKSGIKSEIYLALEFWEFGKDSFSILEISLKPSKIIKLRGYNYVVNEHYTTLKPLIKKNHKSIYNSHLNDTTFITKILNMKLFINWKFLKKIKTAVFSFYKLEEDLSIKSFYEILKEKKRFLWKKSIQREFNQLLSLKYFFIVEEMFCELKLGFYFKAFFDFRGRLYIDSPISYTNNMYFRFSLNYGVYTEHELGCFRKSLKEVDIKYSKKILADVDFTKHFNKLDFEDVLVQYYVSQVLINIGKLYKNEFIIGLGGVISLEQFIDIGLKKWNNSNFSDLNTHVEHLSLINILEEVGDGIFNKTPLYKDATASGPQMLALLLGGKSYETYQWCNLTTNNDWNDTYYHIINKFLSQEDIPETNKNFFTRKNLKKTIMIYNYNATYFRCWLNFVEDAGLDNFKFFEKRNEIQPIFKKFYLFLQKLFETDEYYGHPPTQILFYFQNIWSKQPNTFFETTDKFYIWLKYNMEGDLLRFDRWFGGLKKSRNTITFLKLSEDLDEKKTFRSLQANITHATDALFLRHVVLQLGDSVITIHDSIGIDILRLKKLQNAAEITAQYIFDLNIFNIPNRIELQVSSSTIFI